MGLAAVLCLSLSLPCASLAQSVDLAARGMDHFYNLEYTEAIRDFQAAVQQQPESAERHNLLAQGVLFNLMLRSGALESQMVTGNNPFLRRPKMEPTAAENQMFADSVEAAIKISDQRLKANPSDGNALYTKGVALGLRGNYNFLVKRAWMDALKDLSAARKLHNQVTELEPDNIDAKLLQGMHDYIVGSLPFSYRMLGFLAGVRGDRELGIKTIQQVAEKGHRNKVDAMILLGVIYRREKRPQDVLPLIQELLKLYPRNYLFLMELSQMYSDLGDKSNALAALDRVQQLKSSGAPGYKRLPQERIDFARGNLLFWYGEIDLAVKSLKRATSQAHALDLNSGVLSWMRLGQCYDLLGRRQDAEKAYRAAIDFAPTSDPAKESKRYLDRPYRKPI